MTFFTSNTNELAYLGQALQVSEQSLLRTGLRATRTSPNLFSSHFDVAHRSASPPLEKKIVGSNPPPGCKVLGINCNAVVVT
jgi:hypothetical protein